MGALKLTLGSNTLAVDGWYARHICSQAHTESVMYLIILFLYTVRGIRKNL
jgi:hypothetical protein